MVGVSTDYIGTLEAFTKQNGTKHLLLSDFRRTALPAFDAINTDETSPAFRYSKRAYFIIGKDGVIKYMKIQPNSLDLLDPQEVLTALKSVS